MARQRAAEGVGDGAQIKGTEAPSTSYHQPHAIKQSEEHRSRQSTQTPGNRSAQEPVGLDLTALVTGLTVVAILFQMHAPEPYMDEPFHAPQTQSYCRGQFSKWDPKITTFPGLYIFGAAAGWLYHQFVTSVVPSSGFAQVPLCDIVVLRTVNIGFAAACFLCSYAIYRKLHPHLSSEFATQMALLVILLPTNFFYIFMFYTDVGSLAAVLATLLAVLHQRYAIGAVAAGIAVLFRQTNAVWAAFMLMVAILQHFSKHKIYLDQQSGLVRQLFVTAKLCWLNKSWLCSRLWPLALVPASFAIFVLWNGGIVVGDRSNHTPKLHLVQPLYFLLFTAGAFAQIHAHPSRLVECFRAVTAAFQRKPSAVLRPMVMAFVLTAYVVHNYTLAHPFLLADNRHYVFYLWKDVIAPYPAAKYGLIPLYLFASWSIWDSLQRSGQPDIWIAGLAVCTTATLAPAWLLELRYFTIPFTLVALYMQPPTQAQVLQTIAAFALVNAVTVYMFLFRPFKWGDGSTARFMW